MSDGLEYDAVNKVFSVPLELLDEWLASNAEPPKMRLKVPPMDEDNWNSIPEFARAHVFRYSTVLQSSHIAESDGEIKITNDVPVQKANLICSDLPNGKHKPMLDIDIPAALVPSSTPGHGHLYLDKELTWEQYERLLTVLWECGIIQEGVHANAVKRKYTGLRLPWHSKSTEEYEDYKEESNEQD